MDTFLCLGLLGLLRLIRHTAKGKGLCAPTISIFPNNRSFCSFISSPFRLFAVCVLPRYEAPNRTDTLVLTPLPPQPFPICIHFSASITAAQQRKEKKNMKLTGNMKLVAIAAVAAQGSTSSSSTQMRASAFTVAPLTTADSRIGSRSPVAAAQLPAAGRAQSTTLYNGQFVSGAGDHRAPGFTGFQGSGPRGGGGGGGGVSDEDAWFQEQVRQAQDQQGGGGSSQGRTFLDMGELEEKQRREEERRMRMDDEARMPMAGGGGGQADPRDAGNSPFASDFASQVREASKDSRQRGAITNMDGRVFVDMDELERQKDREDEERMRREMEREKREVMEKEMRREASKGPGPRPPGGPRGRPGPMGGGPMGVATAAAAGLAAAMFQSDGPLPPPPGSRNPDDGDAGFGDNSEMMYQSGPPPPPPMQSSPSSPNPLVPYAPPPADPSDASNSSSSASSPSPPTKGGAVVKLDDKTKLTVDIISGKCDKISSASDVINSKSDGIQVRSCTDLCFFFFCCCCWNSSYFSSYRPAFVSQQP